MLTFKCNLLFIDGQSEPVDPEEESGETWTEVPSDDYQDAIIHCGCNSQEEDGLMLQVSKQYRKEIE